MTYIVAPAGIGRGTMRVDARSLVSARNEGGKATNLDCSLREEIAAGDG